MINIFHDKIISHEFEKRVVIGDKQKTNADNVLILSTIEDQNQLKKNCADLYCANDKVKH